jgi:hypothetical protein
MGHLRIQSHQYRFRFVGSGIRAGQTGRLAPRPLRARQSADIENGLTRIGACSASFQARPRYSKRSLRIIYDTATAMARRISSTDA